MEMRYPGDIGLFVPFENRMVFIYKYVINLSQTTVSAEKPPDPLP